MYQSGVSRQGSCISGINKDRCQQESQKAAENANTWLQLSSLCVWNASSRTTMVALVSAGKPHFDGDSRCRKSWAQIRTPQFFTMVHFGNVSSLTFDHRIQPKSEILLHNPDSNFLVHVCLLTSTNNIRRADASPSAHVNKLGIRWNCRTDWAQKPVFLPGMVQNYLEPWWAKKVLDVLNDCWALPVQRKYWPVITRPCWGHHLT